MIVLLQGLGLIGIPIASIITSSLFGWLAYHWTRVLVDVFSTVYPKTLWRVWISRLILLIGGIMICLTVQRESWLFVLVVGIAIAGIGGMALLYVDPLLKSTRTSFIGLMKNRTRLLYAGIKN
jgi:hypothetical protein